MMTYDQTMAPPSPRTGAMLLAAGFGTYAAVVLTLSGTGTYGVINSNLFPATILIASVGLIIAYFVVPSINAFGKALGPHSLAYFHVWRVFAGFAFIYYGAQGWLPDLFVHRAGYGDIISGLLAGLLLFLPQRIFTVTGFHIVGCADLLLAVGTGVYLNTVAPESIQGIISLPIAMIPLIGVPLALVAHVAAFDQLLAMRRS